MKSLHSYIKYFFLSFFIYCFYNYANAQDESIKTFGNGLDGIYSVSFSSTGKQLISLSLYDSLKIWNVESGKNIKSFFADGDETKFSMDGKFLATHNSIKFEQNQNDKIIKIWNVTIGKNFKTLSGVNGFVSGICFSPDGKRIASADERNIKIWDLTTGQIVKAFNEQSNSVHLFCFSPDGKCLATSDKSNRDINIISVTTGKILKTFNGHSRSVESVCFSQNGKYIASGSSDSTIKIWNVESGEIVKTLFGHDNSVRSVCFSPDGKLLASGSFDQTVKVWNSVNGDCIKTFGRHTNYVLSVCFSPDGKYIVSAGGEIKFWEIQPINFTIKKYVENKITSWQQKDEFEKSSDYALRISEENRKLKIAQFQKQCIDELALAEERKIYASYKNFNLQKYDADAETYLIDANTYGNIILKVPVASALEFKEIWRDKDFTILNPHFEFTGENFVLTHLEFFLINVKKKFSYDISEKYKYTNLNIEYKFNPIEVDVTGKTVDTQNPNISQKNLVVGKSDVDYFELIPQTKTQNPDAIAVIIGNSNYINTKPVAYAINDAESVKNYLIKTLGFKEGNILMKENATLGDFNTLFGTKDNQRGRLANTIKEGVSDVFIFYAGHGAPGLKDNKGYFVPVECDPNYVENSGYQLDVFYQNLAQLKAKSVTIILDACFSGIDIFENISPIVVKVKDPILLIPNAVVITSSSGTEVSTWYEEKQHGMFTYFFLKAIQDKEHSDKNKDGQLTFDEIYDYVSNKNEGVPYYARRIHGIDQTPTIMGDRKDKVFIKY